MFMLNGPAAAIVMGAMAFIGLTMLLLTYRDTLRSIREFFDPSVFRRLFRLLRRVRPQFSLKALLLTVSLGPPCAVYVFGKFSLLEAAALGVFLSGPLLVVWTLISWCFDDAFGRGPRKHWKKYVEQEDFQFDDHDEKQDG